MSYSRLIPALACVLALAACGSPSSTTTASPSPSASVSPSVSASATPTATVATVDSLDAIKVTGERLSTPKVTFKAPLVIDKTRSKVLVAGTGPGALADGAITVHYLGVDGRTGETFDESFTSKKTATFSLAQVVPGFTAGLTGQKAGSRVLIAMPGEDGYDAAGGNPDAGIEVGDTLIFVVDIIAVSVAGPTGKAVTPAAGLPTVTGDGKPTITIPSGNPPTKMVAQPLTEGTGNKVAKTDTIMARYVGYSWKTGKLIDDGFDAPTTGLLTDLIPGWQTGLVGKPVGSRVLLVLPPADGFPEGSNNPPVEKGDTVVYVVDVLFASAGA